MQLDFGSPGSVKVKMDRYISELLESCPEEFRGESTTPASPHLFLVNEDAEKLDIKAAAYFHHLVAKCLFLCKRARLDIQLAVGFLCGRVRAPDIDDNKKLRKLLQYLRTTRELHLTLEAEEPMIAKWWIDSSFAVHPDSKSHSGAIMSLGKGSLYSGCQKQKPNGRSSTEAQLISVDDFVGQILCTRNFLRAQDYSMGRSVVHQYNRSAMLLEKNGRRSGSKRTRHIDMRLYFTTHRIDKGDVEVRHYPAENMTGDFFTKPLQGSAFRKFRDLILNIQSYPIQLRGWRTTGVCWRGEVV